MKVEVVVENTLGANVGDFVEVEMGEKYVLTAAAIVYVIPLVLIGAGIGIGTLINELAQALLALAGLLWALSSQYCSIDLSSAKRRALLRQ